MFLSFIRNFVLSDGKVSANQDKYKIKIEVS